MRTRAKFAACLLALAILAPVMLRAAPDPAELAARVVKCERMQNHAGAIAAFEALPHTSGAGNSGVFCACYPSAALAYDAAGRPADALRVLETLRNLIIRRAGYLQRSPRAMSDTLAALASLAPSFASPDARELIADTLARAGYKPQA